MSPGPGMPMATRSAMQSSTEHSAATSMPGMAPVVAPVDQAERDRMPRFTDAEGALRWLKTLPVANATFIYDAILGQLKALAAADLAPRERARIAEVLREQVLLLHIELARRYGGKPQPLAPPEKEAAEQAIALWHALWEQYAVCRRPLVKGDPDLVAVKS